MTNDDLAARKEDGKRPTLVLLGEFSAGKSTLANVLLRTTQSTVRVTATQAPPIWYVFGTGMPVHISADGTETELESTYLADFPLHNTLAVRVPVQADILREVTILDMPGSSDPNMSSGVWDDLLPLADVVIWCTPATQAWRQSEAAVWDMVPELLRKRSVLLLTRMDKVAPSTDRARIINRVQRETEGLFRAVLPVSLLNVSTAPANCDASGMKQVMRALSGALTGAPIEGVPRAAGAAPIHTATPKGADRSQPAAHIVPRRVAVEGLGAERRILRRPTSKGHAL